MSKSVLNLWDTGYIGPLAVCVNQYFNCFIGEHVFLWLFLVSTPSIVNPLIETLFEVQKKISFVIHRHSNKYVKARRDLTP